MVYMFWKEFHLNGHELGIDLNGSIFSIMPSACSVTHLISNVKKLRVFEYQQCFARNL